MGQLDTKVDRIRKPLQRCIRHLFLKHCVGDLWAQMRIMQRGPSRYILEVAVQKDELEVVPDGKDAVINDIAEDAIQVEQDGAYPGQSTASCNIFICWSCFCIAA